MAIAGDLPSAARHGPAGTPGWRPSQGARREPARDGQIAPGATFARRTRPVPNRRPDRLAAERSG